MKIRKNFLPARVDGSDHGLSRFFGCLSFANFLKVTCGHACSSGDLGRGEPIQLDEWFDFPVWNIEFVHVA